MDILYQDKRILVAVKPAGVLSTDEPGGMPSLLRTFLGDEKACGRTVHRPAPRLFAASRSGNGSSARNIWRWCTAHRRKTAPSATCWGGTMRDA